MKTKQIVQWIVFAVSYVGGMLLLGMGIGVLAYAVLPGLAVIASVLSLILCMAFGLVWGYSGVLVWISLAERGWFFKSVDSNDEEG